MIKKQILIIFCFLLFLVNINCQVYAQSVSTSSDQDLDSTDTTTETNPWVSFWNNILSFFGLLKGTNTYISKDIKIDGDTSGNYDYNQENFDITTRSLTYQNQKIQKGIYLNQLIHNKNGYENKSYLADGCNSITLTQMVYFFYTKGEKILYDTDKNLLDYDSSLMEQYKTEFNSSENCYYTVYDRSPSVPQGKFQDEVDAAPATSTQLNESIRMYIPANQQGDDIPTDNSDPDNAEKITKDTNKQEKTMLASVIPASYQDAATLEDREYLRDEYDHWLHPDSWEDDLPERGEEWPLDSGGSSSGSCNALRSHCRGMSQYGAYGMAKSGKSYLDILKFYYGDIAIKTISTSSRIKVSIDDNDPACPNGSYLTIEQYLTGLGEMPDYWGKLGFEALKAQVIAARTYAYSRTKAFTKPICNSSNCQVFKCKNMGSKPYLSKAVQATAGQIIVDATNLTVFSTEYARSFCGPSKTVTYDNHIIPSVNGYQYEVTGNNGKPAYCK